MTSNPTYIQYEKNLDLICGSVEMYLDQLQRTRLTLRSVSYFRASPRTNFAGRDPNVRAGGFALILYVQSMRAGCCFCFYNDARGFVLHLYIWRPRACEMYAARPGIRELKSQKRRHARAAVVACIIFLLSPKATWPAVRSRIALREGKPSGSGTPPYR